MLKGFIEIIVISVKSYVAYPMSHHLSDPAIMADDVDNLGLFTLHTGRKTPIKVNLQINNKPVSFQLDTGAALSVMTEKDFHTFFKSVPLQVCTKALQTYSGQSFSVLGECVIEVDHNGQQQRLPLLVVKGNGPPLMGRNWLEKIQLDWTSIFCVNPSEQLEQ
ncbi:hypothetical protein RRG08_057493 [Elysia crispata]|uniref:Retropepsins domain-containing protein n=1 Tax=Elysia crispata TaxID=231223 RepID=A0AAE0ZSM8_9GAST|nr:hypothetical protein RRG08_057493 [Elysia crispata]